MNGLRRTALALAMASTALLGSASQSDASVIHYTIKGSAFWDRIPGLLPGATALDTFTGSFEFDPTTQTQTNVIINVDGDLDPGLYAAAFPRSGSLPSACASCGILAGQPPETNTVVVFTETINITFARPLGNVTDPIMKVSIYGFRSGNPCTAYPGCVSNLVTGQADPGLARVAVPEPTSFATFAPASVLCLGFYWVSRRRRMT